MRFSVIPICICIFSTFLKQIVHAYTHEKLENGNRANAAIKMNIRCVW